MIQLEGDGYYFRIKLDEGFMANTQPADSPARLAEMFVQACQVAVKHDFVDTSEMTQFITFYVEDDDERDLTPLEDAAMRAALEQHAGGERVEWS